MERQRKNCYRVETIICQEDASFHRAECLKGVGVVMLNTLFIGVETVEVNESVLWYVIQAQELLFQLIKHYI
jgi:hypothetical protein